MELPFVSKKKFRRVKFGLEFLKDTLEGLMETPEFQALPIWEKEILTRRLRYAEKMLREVGE